MNMREILVLRPGVKMGKENHIHVTTNYRQFKILFGNRKISKGHVSALIKSMAEKYIPVPIIVNEKMEIIDGQHRFQAIEHLGLELHYKIINSLNLPDVQRLNARNRSWSFNDSLDSYCDLGKADYINFKKFKIEHKFANREILTLLLNDRLAGQNDEKSFKDGHLKISEHRLNVANKRAKEILDLTIFYKHHENKSKGVRNRYFVNAMCLAYKQERFSYLEFVHQLKKKRNKDKLEDLASQTAYQSVIENIYNYQRDLNALLRVE